MDFSRVEKYLELLADDFGIPGCGVSVWMDNKEVYSHSAGYTDEEKTTKFVMDSLCWMYSASKITTVVAVMQLVELGKINLEDEVCKYLPEYKEMKVLETDGTLQPAKEKMTIVQMLAMRSGMDYQLEREATKKLLSENPNASTREIVASFADGPLSFEPGEKYQYSLSLDVLAAIVEVVTGNTFEEYVQENIFKPLGMEYSGYHLTDEARKKFALEYSITEDFLHIVPIGDANPYVFNEIYESGGAGVISSAKEYVKLLGALANEGVGATGYRVLKPESIREMCIPRTSMKEIRRFYAVEEGHDEYAYGLGVRVRMENEYSKLPIGEFGWDGAAGSYAMIDPVNRVSIMYTQHILYHLTTFCKYQMILRELIYEALEL